MANPFLARATVVLRITFLLSGKRVFAFSNLYQITFAHFWAQLNFALDALLPRALPCSLTHLSFSLLKVWCPPECGWVVVVRELIARLPTPLGGGSTTYIRSIYCAPLFLRTAHNLGYVQSCAYTIIPGIIVIFLRKTLTFLNIKFPPTLTFLNINNQTNVSKS